MDTFYVFLCSEVHFIHYTVKCCIIFTRIYNYLLRYFLYLYLILQVWHDQDSLLKRVNMHAIVDIGEMYPVVIHHCHMYLQPHHPVSLMSFSAHPEAHQDLLWKFISRNTHTSQTSNATLIISVDAHLGGPNNIEILFF